MSFNGSKFEDEEVPESGPTRTQTFGPPLTPKVPGDHEESLFLMALGEQVSNERNKASGVKVTSERGATERARVSESNEGRRTLTLDVARAFRQKMLSIGSFGVLAFRLSGHTYMRGASFRVRPFILAIGVCVN